MEQDQCTALHLSVQPSRALFDERLTVTIEHARPGSKLTVHACLMNGPDKWESFGHYVTNITGTVNLLEDPSLGGTYSGVRPMGLMESLKTVYGEHFYKFESLDPLEVTFSVYMGHQTEDFTEERRVACALVERWFISPGVQSVAIDEPHLNALLFLPPGPGPFPAVLDLQGGAEGLLDHRAALLASHGFAAMAINYTRPDVKTGKLVDCSYFETAYKTLQQHPQVDGSRIAMLGFCLGAVLTLKMATSSDVMKLACAISVSGSHAPPAKGTLNDMMKFCIENTYKCGLTEHQEIIIRDMFLPIPTDPEEKLDMGRLQCPLLFIAGEDDLNAPCPQSAPDIKAMMEKAGNSHLLTTLLYPKTGHVIDVAYTPHYRASRFKPLRQKAYLTPAWGGEPAAHCAAEEDAWWKVLAYLKKHLYC